MLVLLFQCASLAPLGGGVPRHVASWRSPPPPSPSPSPSPVIQSNRTIALLRERAVLLQRMRAIDLALDEEHDAKRRALTESYERALRELDDERPPRTDSAEDRLRGAIGVQLQQTAADHAANALKDV